MSRLEKIVTRLSQRMGLEAEELHAFFEKGQEVTYQPEAWLFHESSPKAWAGLVLEGEVELVQGLHGNSRILAVLTPGAMISEGAVLDEQAHSIGAMTRGGVTLWTIDQAAIASYRTENPEVFYRIVARIAAQISDRLRMASARKAQESGPNVVGRMRLEHDSLGERELPEHAYYGVQTLRAMENFAISGTFVKDFGHFIFGLAMVKKAAAKANQELGVITPQQGQAISDSCDELLAGKLHDQFAVDMFQGGAGTSTNMCANEVIANRGLELMGYNKGEYKYLHPNDHVNRSQSTNDAYPTSIKLGILLSLQDLLGGMRELQSSLASKAVEFADVLKMGRTENQDAVPMTMGQEFSAYATMVSSAMSTLERAGEQFKQINMGATAIGTGINSPAGYADLVTIKLSEVSGFDLKLAENLVEATANVGSFVLMSASMKLAAVQISKICKDLRWMSSGPRCGLNEINLPPMQPGSSIMPGKVNPVIPEVVNQICYQIMGYDMVVSMAAEASEFELCMAEPIIAYDLFHGMLILRNACVTLSSRCIVGIEANREVCAEYVKNSIGLVTALSPVIGYEKSAAIAKEALHTGGSVYDLVLEKGWLKAEELDDLLRPETMTDPRRVQH
ncbi:MAG: aspartate ammonia-lyase [Planctomycetota bacterium]|jgi:aspartate ammonia-lyase